MNLGSPKSGMMVFIVFFFFFFYGFYRSKNETKYMESLEKR